MMPRVVYVPGENRPYEVQRRSSYDFSWDCWSRHRWLWVAKLVAWDLQRILGKATRVVTDREVCPQPCEHLSQHDAREGRTCPEHPCTCTDREIRAREEQS